MDAKLVAIAGPPEGSVYDLDQDEFYIGRDLSNHIAINDPSVSRRHCLIKLEGKHFKICDLESANGTQVDGVQVVEHLLTPGDHIKVGAAVFLFHYERQTNSTSDQTSSANLALSKQITITLEQEEALYLQPEKIGEILPQTDRLSRDLNALLKIGNIINSIRDTECLQQQLLELIFEIVPAESGAIILTPDFADDSAKVVGRRRTPADNQPVTFSRTIVNRVLKERKALLINEEQEPNLISSAPSLIISQTQSLLAVPLVAFGQKLGVLYLHSNSQQATFDENHLQLVTAVAAMATVALENARYVAWLEGENHRLNDEAGLSHSLVGESAKMRAVYQLVSKAAPTDSTILIRGESGTGKELAARAVHLNSPRSKRPFIAINCAALTDTLLESELFGHEKGAFTGATTQKKGKFEEANGGTVFLDEMGEMSPLLQAKLLRVIQERNFERVGGTRSITVDIRVIAATNKDLEKAVADGSFRNDLYYRLNVVTLNMPPLRERRGDIASLAEHFAKKYSQKCKRPIIGISPAALSLLTSYDWPGNVRELENTIERAIVLGVTETIMPEDLPETIVEAENYSNTSVTKYHEATKEAKKSLVLEAIEKAGGNYKLAAETLGIHPNNLHRLIRTLGLRNVIKP